MIEPATVDERIANCIILIGALAFAVFALVEFLRAVAP